MPGKPISEVVELLDVGQAERAWGIFLKNYNATIMQVVRHFENDPDLASDCFIFICEKLCENDFDRLRQFDPRRGVRFRSWLSAVVSNLCIDWQRHLYGRPRPFSVIRSLPELEQAVFHLRYETGLDLRSCFSVLQASFPGIERQDVSDAMGHVHAALKPRQRWRLSFRQRDHAENPAERIELADGNPGPELMTEARQELESLRIALGSLDSEQRLLLRLRFQEDLSLKEVARLTGLGSASQARHRINGALARLGELMSSVLPAA